MIYVNSVCVSPEALTLQVGKGTSPTEVIVCPLNADCRELCWRSDNSTIASVHPTSGYITANSAGTTTIHATAIDGSGCSDCITVTVKDNAYSFDLRALNK